MEKIMNEKNYFNPNIEQDAVEIKMKKNEKAKMRWYWC